MARWRASLADEEFRRNIFDPMLSSLNVYALIP